MSGAKVKPSDKTKDTAESRPKLFWADPLISLVFGLLFGVLVFVAGRFAFAAYQPDHKLSLAEPAKGNSSPRLLLEAETDQFTYRASGIDLQPGSDILSSIMSQLPAEITALQAGFAVTSSAPSLIDVTYQRLASSGPVHSLVRIERRVFDESRSEISYATSLFNSLAPTENDIRPMFGNYPGMAPRLTKRLCREIQKQKAIRIGKSAVFDCEGFKAIDFFEGAPHAFVRSDQPNQFGGLRYYFSAGSIGDVSEGMYIVTVPQSEFRSELKEGYQSLFGGSPAAAN